MSQNPSSIAQTRLLVLVVLLTALFGWLLLQRIPGIGDEYATIPQVEIFLSGDWTVRDDLAVPPTYHALVASIARLLGIRSVQQNLNGLRLISLLLSLPVVAWFFLCARKIDSANASLRSLEFLFLPILLPYLFILTTDAFALTIFVLAVWLALEDHPALAGVAALLDVLVRQNQIVWVAWLFVWTYLRDHGWSLRPALILRHLVRGWTFCLIFAGFVVFVIKNHGLTLGHHEQVHPPGVYLGNVWFALFLCSFLLWPIFLVRLPNTLGLIRRRPLLLVAVGLVFVLYSATFQVTDPANDLAAKEVNKEFLRNRLLDLATSNLATRTAFFLPIALAILSLAALPLHERGSWSLYPFWVLAIIPVRLIEQRYSLSGFTMLLLLRVLERRRVEWLQLAWFVLVSLFILWGISRAWFFL